MVSYRASHFRGHFVVLQPEIIRLIRFQNHASVPPGLKCIASHSIIKLHVDSRCSIVFKQNYSKDTRDLILLLSFVIGNVEVSKLVHIAVLV